MKTNLPVIILKNIVLLPTNEIKLEIKDESSKNIIDASEMFHDKKVLIITNKNPLEEVQKVGDLPKLGVVAKIKQKLVLPDGSIRITLKGLSRARIFEYLNLKYVDENLEAILELLVDESDNDNNSKILLNKLKKEVDKYIEEIPYMSNSISNTIKGIDDLSTLTDVIAYNLSLNLERKQEYLYEISSTKRVEMLLEDIYNEFKRYSVEKEIDMKVSQNIDDSQREYILREKMKALQEELGDNSLKNIEVEDLKNRVSKIKANKNVKDTILKEINRYENLSIMSPELDTIRNYIDWLISLPWNIETKDEQDLNKIKQKLDRLIYGNDELKERVLEYIAVKKFSNNKNGSIICLVGPPGVGKTSFASKLASALNKNFVKISLGGVHDEAEIRGHRRSYLGSNPGRIISSMRKAKSNNPVFLIDEVDKITSDTKGDPASALLEVLDKEQNKCFSDNFIEIEYDLSHVLFILTANSLDDIPLALRDRLEIIEMTGYSEFEKVTIANNYLIPNVLEECNLTSNSIEFTIDSIKDIIKYYTKETGVRELQRKIEKIIRRIIVSLEQNKINIDKLKVTSDNLDKYLGKRKYDLINNNNETIGVANALGCTQYGGEILKIETNYYKGAGKLELTGSLGDILIESAKLALSYIKSNYELFDINYDELINNDIHIHIPVNQLKKDGPSAGISIVSSIISAFTNMDILNKIAFSGEITLHGNILPVGGIKEKVIAATRNNIDTIFLPKGNKKDLDLIDEEVKENINFIFVDNYMEIYEVLKEGLK